MVSQIMHNLNDGEHVERRLRFNPRELLIFINRGLAARTTTRSAKPSIV